MKKIEVCFTPELIHLYSLQDKVVVIVDILRATSTMVAGLASGVKKIAPVAHLEETEAFAKSGYLVAGERDGKKIEGFDLGNSPFEFMDIAQQKPSIVMTTTNGTKALKFSESAEKIIVGSFLNITAVADLLSKITSDIVIFCAGWKGKFNLEDTLFAGALIKSLQEKTQNIMLDCDSAIAAKSLYTQHEKNLIHIIKQASHVSRLSSLAAKKDVEFCLKFNLFDNVPYYTKQHLINS